MGTPNIRRILLKLSGESLAAGHKDRAFCEEGLTYIAAELETIHKLQVRCGIVLGGGNIFRGARSALPGLRRTTGDQVGMLATVQNALVLRDLLLSRGIPTFVSSMLDIPGVVNKANPTETAAQVNDQVVIFAGGTGSPFFSTDTAAALRAIEIGAEVILKATTVDGVYDRDPRKDPQAVRYAELTMAEALEKNLGIMDRAAFALCQEHRIPIHVFDFFKPGNLSRAVSGADVGTRVLVV